MVLWRCRTVHTSFDIRPLLYTLYYIKVYGAQPSPAVCYASFLSLFWLSFPFPTPFLFLQSTIIPFLFFFFLSHAAKSVPTLTFKSNLYTSHLSSVFFICLLHQAFDLQSTDPYSLDFTLSIQHLNLFSF